MNSLDERALRIFTSVVRQASIRKAAETLDMAPSIVSRQIALLEKRAGLALFDRSSRGVRLTEAGQLLNEHARRVLEETGLLSEQLDILRGVQQANVRIRCGEGFLADLLEHSLKPYSVIFPQVRYSVHLGATDTVGQSIVDGEADIGILYNPPIDVRLRSLAIRRQGLCLVVHAGHYWANRTSVSFEECADQSRRHAVGWRSCLTLGR